MIENKSSIDFNLQTLVNELAALLAASILANHPEESLTAAEIHHSIVGLFSEAAGETPLRLPPSLLYPLMKQLCEAAPKGDGLLNRKENVYSLSATAPKQLLPQIDRALAFADKLSEYLRETKKHLAPTKVSGGRK